MVIMVNYDLFAGTFSNSRKNLKWEEIEYFLTSFLFEHSPLTPLLKGEGKRVLDV
ncbi:MAG: hypothetical protein LBC61_00025 [Candidatus Peribacteria bacterium]|nr:hypothetical protein [Candidatus Peribacteria bacterium]